MKQGGAFLAIILTISGILRMAGPGVASPRQNAEDTEKKKQPATHDSTKQYEDDLRRTIQQFFTDGAEGSPKDVELVRHWNVPDYAGAAHSVIAILPDPLHTRLALTFDRGIETILQAAARKGYRFDRAILPWNRTPIQNSDDLTKRRETLKDQRDREEFPGLLIFRGLQGIRYKAPLFVFVVGETPTGGIRKAQFNKAVKIANEMRYSATTPERLLILGPTTSGALQSLNQELAVSKQVPDTTEIYIYSGTVTDEHTIRAFGGDSHRHRHFASFLENDRFVRELFLQFVCHNGYPPDEVATLSESDTVYGLQRASAPPDEPTMAPAPPKSIGACTDAQASDSVVQLTFPREISYFRSAYQKQAQSQSKPEVPAATSQNLTVDSEELGTDDDAALPYAGAQTPQSQESVMLGIVSQLQKRHVRFTLLYASDPLDQLFLAGYLRSKYPQGRVVITTPDLLLTSQENNLLRGVLGLSSYSLAAGLADSLCPFPGPPVTHHDRIFVSVSSVGMFNAAVALLDVIEPPARSPFPTPDSSPFGELSGYGTPIFTESGGSASYCEARPLVWVTMLGRDGFWPVAGLTDEDMTAVDHKLPLLGFDTHGHTSTLFPQNSATVAPRFPAPATLGSRTPAAWRLAYCVCLFFVLLHIYLSSTGSILAESESCAQFTCTGEARDVKVIALGALALSTAFVTLMFTRSPLVYWDAPIYTILLWLPFGVFLVFSIWDFGWHRSDPWSAVLFLAGVLFMFACQWVAWFGGGTRFARAYWSTRLLHIGSGISPVLPILLLAAAGYWWMWQSLRGVTLVDLRRPRLPRQRKPEGIWHSISDAEADELRTTAHPLYVKGGITLSIAALCALVLVLLDWQHPVQTIEGKLYDWFYAASLALMVVSLLSCLLKLLWTWSTCQQILSGLDRLPLRAAFGRMKHLSWSSLWNPGGSSMRATYKIMSRGLEDLGLLQRDFLSPPATTPSQVVANAAIVSARIAATIYKRKAVQRIYASIVSPMRYRAIRYDVREWRRHKIARWCREVAVGRPRFTGILLGPEVYVRLQCREIAQHLRAQIQESFWLDQLLTSVGALQKSMAETAATIMEDALLPWWATSKDPAVSRDEALPKKSLEPLQAMAEEYVALTYINFLVTVLLRMRTLVITAIGVFVLIVLSMNVYPFEPHPALQTLAVGLAIAMVAVIGYVYAKMHRDSILSLMTSNTPGELGWDFWLKLGSAVAIPVFSLLAVQFPEINQFLFSWLEPALQAAK